MAMPESVKKTEKSSGMPEVLPVCPASGTGNAVELINVVFTWPGQKQATVNIENFTVPEGGLVFISGPSGSGKSTLLSLIGGILQPSAGKILVNGTNITALTGSQRDMFRGNSIGFIFQQFNLIPYLSILDNVLIPCRLSPEREQRARVLHGSPYCAATKLLERLDLAPALWDRQVTQLSAGQQQRVAAARAFLGSPPLLIADEPTSSLDTDRQNGFLNLLLRECKESGSSLLFVSHDMRLADAFSLHLRLTEVNQPGAKP